MAECSMPHSALSATASAVGSCAAPTQWRMGFATFRIPPKAGPEARHGKESEACHVF
jgi:hypothetical protein